jgi:hypothetical protein
LVLAELIIVLTIGHFKNLYYATCGLNEHLQARFYKLVVASVVLNSLGEALELTIFIRKVQGRYVDLTV